MKPGQRNPALVILAGALALAAAVVPAIADVGGSGAFGWKQFSVAVLGGFLVVWGIGLLARSPLHRIAATLVPAQRPLTAVAWRLIARDPVVLGAAGAALAFQILYGLLVDAQWDVDGYVASGQHFREWWRTVHTLPVIRTPGYPLFLSLHYELGLGNSGVRVSQSVLLSATVVAIAVMAGDVGGRLAARVAAVTAVAYVPLLTFSAVALTEAVAVPLTTFAALAVMQAARRPDRRLRYSALASALGTGATLTNPHSAMYLGVIVVALVLVRGSPASRLRVAAVAALTAAVLAAPWAVHNLSNLGRPALFGSNGTYPLALGTHLPQDTDIGQHSAFRRSYRFFSRTRSDGFTPELAAATDPWEQLRQNLTARPADFAWARLVAEFQMWFWPQEARVQVGGSSPVPYGLLMLVHLAVLFAGLVGLLRLRRSLIGQLGLGFVAVTAAVHVVYWTTPRYALSVFPFLIAGTGMLVASILQPVSAGPSARNVRRWLVRVPPPSPVRQRPSPVPPWGRTDYLVLLGLAVLGALIYAPHAFHAGWYYDDWDIYALMQDAGGIGAGFSACVKVIPAGRDAACAFHAAEYGLLGGWRAGYHLMSLLLLLATSGLLYAIVRRCGMARPWAAAVCALLITYPASDSTRLWPIASIAQFVIVLQLLGLALALKALEIRGLRANLLHAVSIALAVAAMVTYEVTLPLVALQGLVYLAAFRSRAVLWRGFLDLGLALAFVVWRLAVNPVEAGWGIVVHRTTGQTVERGRFLLDSAWHTWHQAFAPGALGVLCLLGVVALVATVAWRDPAARPRLLGWVAALAIACVTLGATALVYITANDLYYPQLDSIFNRLNVAGAAAACVACVALVGMTYEAGRRLLSSPLPALGAIVVLCAIGVNQIDIERDHQASWKESWRVQREALAGYRQALRAAPANAAVIGFDTPTWERGFVPVFAATWDLRSAIDYVTRVDPPLAAPWFSETACGRQGVDFKGALFAAYRNSAAPLYFVRPSHGLAVRVTSQRQCGRLTASWGLPPFWGRTVTGRHG